MTNDDKPDLSPLERYLAKRQKTEEGAPETAAPSPPPPASPPPPIYNPPPRAAAPPEPTPGAGPIRDLDYHPAAFFPRFLAYIIDVFIVGGLSVPVYSVLGGLFDMLSFSRPGGGPFLAVQLVTFIYFGWFYTQKGATPGKIIFGFEVIESRTGQRLTYVRSYLRESFGKYISGLLMSLGFLMALFNSEHKALHDLVFETRVVRK